MPPGTMIQSVIAQFAPVLPNLTPVVCDFSPTGAVASIAVQLRSVSRQLTPVPIKFPPIIAKISAPIIVRGSRCSHGEDAGQKHSPQ